MKRKRILAEDLILVGFNYTEFKVPVAELLNDENADEKRMKEVFGDCSITLLPELNNKYDADAIIVFLHGSQCIGHLWAGQAAALKSWLKENKQEYLNAHIREFDKDAGVLIAHPDVDIKLNLCMARNKDIDRQWAADIPEVLSTSEDMNISVGINLLRDELREADVWDEAKEERISNVMKSLLIDLSAYCFAEFIEVYNLLAGSKIARARQMAGVLLSMYIKRGSGNQIKWWVNEWLPSFFEHTAESDLLTIFKNDGYTSERVEELLRRAPNKLFLNYRSRKEGFAKRLLYTYLPKVVYDRFLTLLAVRELMLKEKTQAMDEKSKPMSHLPKEKLNFFAPKKNLQSLLREDWFATCCADISFDEKWTDQFVTELMDSEWGALIAREWSVKGVRNKQKQIKGYVVGLLKDAGVLKGSYDAIAKKICRTVNPRVFSRYMGKGKKQPYADWVKTYPKEV